MSEQDTAEQILLQCALEIALRDRDYSTLGKVMAAMALANVKQFRRERTENQTAIIEMPLEMLR